MCPGLGERVHAAQVHFEVRVHPVLPIFKSTVERPKSVVVETHARNPAAGKLFFSPKRRVHVCPQAQNQDIFLLFRLHNSR